jgi:hypothetical protein
MKKNIKKYSTGGPTGKQERLTNRADKAFNKASAAKNKLSTQKDEYGYIPGFTKDGVRYPGMGTVTRVNVYDQPGMEGKKAKLEKKIDRNINKVDKLSQKAASLKKGGVVKKKK